MYLQAHCSTSNMDISDHPYSSYPHYPSTSRSTFPSFRSSNEDISKERLDREAKMFQTQHTVAGIGQSIANKRKSIFESTSNQDEASNNYRKIKIDYFRLHWKKITNTIFYSKISFVVH